MMAGREAKVFKSSSSFSFTWGLVITCFQIGLLTIFFDFTSTDNLGFLFLVIVMETMVFIFLLDLLCKATGKVTITHKTVEISNIFRNKSVPLYSIQRARKWNSGSGFILVVETHQSKIKVGSVLSGSQIDEAAAYIIEQIRVNYPQYYETLKDEETHELEEFWRK